MRKWPWPSKTFSTPRVDPEKADLIRSAFFRGDKGFPSNSSFPFLPSQTSFSSLTTMKKAITMILAGACLVASVSSVCAADKPAKKHPTGYTDTPFLPGGKWRVHDDTRPRPEVVTPGKNNSAPSDAVVLFDGKDLSGWTDAKGNASGWIVENGYMQVPPKGTKGGGDIWTKGEFGDCQLHIEWATPGEVVGDSQGRGNSGIFFFGKYEIQVLDSYDNPSYADGQASALYGWKPPLVNACRKPGEWQTYDIIFEAPRFKDGKLIKKAYVTVIHNGVVTHHRQALLGASGHKRVAQYSAHEEKGRIKLQDHGNPMRFRNIWIRNLDLDSNE